MNPRKQSAVAIVMLAVAVAGCFQRGSSSPESVASVPLSPRIEGLPVSLRVKQRSTTEVPGAANELSLTADDITRGQVMVSLVRKRAPLLGPISMTQGDEASFRFGEVNYRLRLTELNNSLVGEDFATFEISEGGANLLSESRKIDELIKAVESLPGAVFLRNGVEHSAGEAAKHLALKLEAANGAIKTAEQFIEQIASRSSTTGDAYQIRFDDGRTVNAGDYLREELARLNSSGGDHSIPSQRSAN